MKYTLLICIFISLSCYSQNFTENKSGHFKKGIEKSNEGKYRGAIRHFKQDFRSEKSNPLSLYFIGVNYFNLYPFYSKKQKISLQYLDQYMELNPNDPKGYLRRGIIYYGQMDFQKAYSDLDKAISLNPTIPEAYYYRALSRNGNWSRNTQLSKEDIENCYKSIEDINIFSFLSDSTNFLNKCVENNLSFIKSQCNMKYDSRPIRKFCIPSGLLKFDTTEFKNMPDFSIYQLYGIFYQDTTKRYEYFKYNQEKHLQSFTYFRYDDFLNERDWSKLLGIEVDSFIFQSISGHMAKGTSSYMQEYTHHNLSSFKVGDYFQGIFFSNKEVHVIIIRLGLKPDE